MKKPVIHHFKSLTPMALLCLAVGVCPSIRLCAATNAPLPSSQSGVPADPNRDGLKLIQTQAAQVTQAQARLDATLRSASNTLLALQVSLAAATNTAGQIQSVAATAEAALEQRLRDGMGQLNAALSQGTNRLASLAGSASAAAAGAVEQMNLAVLANLSTASNATASTREAARAASNQMVAALALGTNRLAALVAAASGESARLAGEMNFAMQASLSGVSNAAAAARGSAHAATNTIWRTAREASDAMALSASNANRSLLATLVEATNAAARARADASEAVAGIETMTANASNVVAALAMRAASLLLNAATNSTAAIMESVYSATNHVGSLVVTVNDASNTMVALESKLGLLEKELARIERDAQQQRHREWEASVRISQTVIWCMMVMGIAGLITLMFMAWLHVRGAKAPAAPNPAGPAYIEDSGHLVRRSYMTRPGPVEPDARASAAITLRQKGETLLNLGRAHEAISCFEQALADNPGNAKLLLKIGQAREKTDQHEAALASYDEAIRLDPAQTTAYLLKASLLNRLKRESEALACYELALKNQPAAPPDDSKAGSSSLS